MFGLGSQRHCDLHVGGSGLVSDRRPTDEPGRVGLAPLRPGAADRAPSEETVPRLRLLVQPRYFG